MPKQTRGTTVCSVDGCSKINDAPKGLCGEHYRRFRTYGTFEKQRRPKGKSICSVEGCERPDDGAVGLCQKHYLRRWTYGRTHTVQTGKRSHPYYALWFERKADGTLAPEWLDFWRFIADIGERESRDYFLVRPDQSAPYGPDNFEWHKKLRKAAGETRKQFWARKWAARRDANPGMERQRELRRKYGISPEDYAALLAAQDGKCAICRQPETAFDGKTGTIRRLAMDHCHASGKNRSLLCFRCNSTIGRIGEDLDLVDAIRDYLVKHGAKRKVADAA